MDSSESPAAARRRLRLSLRKGREARGLTQGQVADALDWSLSKVQRIEGGETTVSSTDLAAMLKLYGITDEKRVAQLIGFARASRRKGWWDESRFRQHLTPTMMQLLQFEAEASAIRVFHPILIPGVLQTYAYAREILESWIDELSEEDRAVRLEVRMRRREIFLNRPDPPQYRLVLDESVLVRKVVSPPVMAEQMRELLKLAQSQVSVRILPFSGDSRLADLGHFQVLELGDEDNAILYREAQIVDDIEHTFERVELYRQRFERLWQAALPEDETARLIEAKAGEVLPSKKTPPAGGKTPHPRRAQSKGQVQKNDH